VATKRRPDGWNARTAPPPSNLEDSNVWLWDYTQNIWVQAHRDAEDALATKGHVSLAYNFCKRLQARRNQHVCLIMLAAGGTAIAEWLPKGGRVVGAKGKMFRGLSGAYAAAMQAEIPILPNGLRRLGELQDEGADVLLWHQGEADADYRGTTGYEWMARFLKVIDVLRRPAGIGATRMRMLKDDAPILVGTLLSGGQWRGQSTDDRNVEIARLPRRDRNIRIVNARGLESDDGLHFSPMAIAQLGERYFEAYMPPPRRTGLAAWAKGLRLRIYRLRMRIIRRVRNCLPD
jgi:Carbohydrate esterase, sialic acid-specific acetylesterase